MPSKPMTDAEIARQLIAVLHKLELLGRCDAISATDRRWLSDFAEGRAVKCSAKPVAWRWWSVGEPHVTDWEPDWLETTPLYAPQEKPR